MASPDRGSQQGQAPGTLRAAPRAERGLEVLGLGWQLAAAGLCAPHPHPWRLHPQARCEARTPAQALGFCSAPASPL